jgi:hypothetical protein
MGEAGDASHCWMNFNTPIHYHISFVSNHPEVLHHRKEFSLKNLWNETS